MTFRLPLAALALALGVPAVAPAATKNAITPVAPKAGATVKTGTKPTFKVRSTGPGSVWVVVSESRKRDKEGVIKSTADTFFQKARRKGGDLYQVKAKFFDYPEFWLNSPGTYFWQAYRIDCTGDLDDCKREGPVVRIRVG